VFQACLDREIQSGSIGTGLAARYHFSKHFDLSNSRFPVVVIFCPLQTRVFLRPVPKSQYFHDFRCLNNSIYYGESFLMGSEVARISAALAFTPVWAGAVTHH
jgi:hypothetical protein